ncbi:MAG: succinate dehydrogenase/fumarate reductase iron-sulfur subunit [Desulfovibrionaceae bacterium]
MEKILFTIDRFDGTKKYTQDYELVYEPKKTLLSQLFFIKENLDPTLNFTAACRAAICGACGVRVNGNAFLACDTRMEELMEYFDTTHFKIGPMGNFTVISDLVVEWDDKLERLKKTKPTLRPKSEFTIKEGCKQSEENLEKIALQWDCILCGVCASECTALATDKDSFLEPFNFVQAERNASDSRSADPMIHGTPALEGGLWNCVRCFECVKCPKHIKPANRISILRSITIKQGVRNNLGSRHAHAFLTDLQHGGRLNETKLLLRTERIAVLKRSILALRLLLRGKVNPMELFFHTKVTGHDELAHIVHSSMKKGEKVHE